jgi:riboflavin synthase
MFTGIVEERGRVRQPGTRLEVVAGKVGADAAPGDSVAVSGVCLTVVQRREEEGGWILGFDLSDETLRRTSLGSLARDDAVNLERPVTLMQRLGGHLVQGHVDGVGRVAAIEGSAVGSEMTFEAPSELMRYVVEKGSVAVEGVSLTVARVEPAGFGVALIPFTLEATNLGSKRRGDAVNIEVDVMAKYVEGLLRAGIAKGGDG